MLQKQVQKLEIWDNWLHPRTFQRAMGMPPHVQLVVVRLYPLTQQFEVESGRAADVPAAQGRSVPCATNPLLSKVQAAVSSL